MHLATPTAPGAPPPPAARREPVPLPAERLAEPVLIVEDEAMIAWMLESLLEDMGFSTITIVATAGEAVDAAVQHPPALIVSDINLGRGRADGIAAAAAIRAQVVAPVLFVTGHAGPEALDRIHQEVPDAQVLRKPVDPLALRLAVAELVAPRPAN